MPRKLDKTQGEGDKAADRRYREGVRETVESTDAEERAESVRHLTPEEQSADRDAEQAGRSRAKEEDPNISRDYDEKN